MRFRPAAAAVAAVEEQPPGRGVPAWTAQDGPEPAQHAPARPATLTDALPAREREPVLDVLRGFAVLGILLVNIEFMRGPDAYLLFESTAPTAYDAWSDRVAQFAVGWLATGKFLSSFAFMFGIGAALMSARALRSGGSPRPLLARRYAWLALFGLVHMVLLFPGDILFAYGLTGFVLLAFVTSSPPELVRWALLLIAATAIAAVLLVLALSTGEAVVHQDPNSAAALRMAAVDTVRHGSYSEVVSFQARQAFLLQSGGLFLLPWILGLFLLGFATARAGVLDNLRAYRPLLKRGAIIGLALGLPANLVLGFFGPLGGLAADPQLYGAASMALAVVAQLAAAPLLAMGYLSALALACLAHGPIGPLARVGRMALSAYLLQSLIALIVFAGLGWYDRLGPAAALLVVAGIWFCVLAFCGVWSSRFRFGPAEWLWRSLTYGRTQPMRAEPRR
jgi:uncharacterized protein